jgi:iron complex transport system substrate-binding protein
MKKLFILPVLFIVFIMTACNSQTIDQDDAEMFTYQSENGPIQVPANPERVVVLSSFNAGSVMALDVNIVGVDAWAMANERYLPYLGNAVEVSDTNLEQIMDLEPDLIIATPTNNNLDKLGKIAPTVTFTYGNFDYLTTHIEIGKLLNKETEARNWVEDFKARAHQVGVEVKAKIGENATVTVIENFNKQLYVFGDNFGRGTEILYQEMKLSMPEKVKQMALDTGYYALSVEVLPEYAGDYIIVSSDGMDVSYQETATYKNIPAVQNERVFTANASEFYFNDPITLDFQLEFFKTSFLNSN